ncbi:hypothetical protein ACS0TY_023943 [Phlomoides rotata]
MNALKDKDFFSSLSKKPVQTFDELLKTTEKYVTLGEVKKAKKVETKSSTTEKKKEPALKWSTPDPPRGSASRSRGRYERYTPLKMEPAEVLQVVSDHPELKFLYSSTRGPQRPKLDKFYHLHNEYGHDTINNFHLKDKIERMIQTGHLKEFVYRDRQGSRGKKRKELEKKHDDMIKAPQGDIEDQPQSI